MSFYKNYTSLILSNYMQHVGLITFLALIYNPSRPFHGCMIYGYIICIYKYDYKQQLVVYAENKGRIFNSLRFNIYPGYVAPQNANKLVIRHSSWLLTSALSATCL